MSNPDLRLVTEEDEPQGCLEQIGALGLAAYAMIILGMMTIGLTGVVGSIWMMLTQMTVDPAELTTGLDVEQWRLHELRSWEILGAETTPDLYHDHSELRDGSSGCLVAAGEVIRWDEKALSGQATISGADVRSEGAAEAPTVIVADGAGEVACPFRADEGGDRFLTMLRADAER